MRLVSLILFVTIISSTSLLARYNYSLDISPAIRNKNMFSAGFAFQYSENNAYMNDNTLYYGPSDNINITFINYDILLIPYFEFRPISSIELGVGFPFTYYNNESYNLLLNETTILDGWMFDGIHSHIKISIIDWILSFGIRTDANFIFNNRLNNSKNILDNTEVSTTAMLAVVPKIIPVNIIFNYKQHFMNNYNRYGIIIGGVEVITSRILSVTLGAKYMFPYTTDLSFTYVNVFAKISAVFGNYVRANVSYSKNVWGNESPNTASFLVNVDVNF